MEEKLSYSEIKSIAIKERDKAIAKKIEKLKYKKAWFDLGLLTESKMQYNKAIDDVLALLDDEEGE